MGQFRGWYEVLPYVESQVAFAMRGEEIDIPPEDVAQEAFCQLLKNKDFRDSVDNHELWSIQHLKHEHAIWERRIALLKSDDIDPDMLDERARALLDYVDPNDLTLKVSNHPHPGFAASP